MILLEISMFLTFLFLSIIVSMLALEIVSALFQSKNRKLPEITLARERVVILMPAHNEAAVIADTIKNILPQLGVEDRLLVVADNCADNTAKLAKDSGAEVIVRMDASLRGKGYALDFGVQYLKKDPPEVVIIIDADCEVEEGSIDQLAHCVQCHNRPVQALNLLESPDNPSASQKIATFAFFIKNYVRPLGLKGLGLPCHLMGTGMAFPWEIISSADLANGNIVEDIKLGVDLMRQDQAPIFLPDAKVTGVFPTSIAVTKGQRTRWEHGHLDAIFHQVPLLFYEGLKQNNLKLIFLAVDLAVFPLALLTMLLCLSLFVSWLLVLAGGSQHIFNMMFFVLVLFGLSIFCAWVKFGRKIITAIQLLTIPYYVLGKIFIYLNFLTNKQKKWVKTDRDN